MRALGAVIAVGCCTVAGPAISSPARAATSPIPGPGTVVTLTEHARGVELVCAGRRVRFDLDGTGTITVGQTHTDAGHPVVDLTTRTESLHGSGPQVGTVTVTETTPVTGSLTEHSATQPFPAREDMPARLRFTLQHDPCTASEPVVMDTRDTVHLVATVRTFPPPPQGTNPGGSPTGGQLYRLQHPVTLAPRGLAPGPGTVYARLQGMDINVGLA